MGRCSFRLLGVLGCVGGRPGGRALVLVLRVLVHHRLRVACTRCAAVGLVWEPVLLVGRAVLWLVRLRVGAAHRRHWTGLEGGSLVGNDYSLDPGGIWYICGPCAPGCMYIIGGCWCPCCEPWCVIIGAPGRGLGKPLAPGGTKPGCCW